MFTILARSLRIASRNDNTPGRWAAPDHWRESHDRARRMARAEMHRDVPDRRWLEEMRF